MLEYGLAFARVRVNLRRVKIQIQPVTGFYLQQKHEQGLYIITVECKCILFSLTSTGFFTFECSVHGQNCFDKWRQQVRISPFAIFKVKFQKKVSKSTGYWECIKL